MGKLIDLRGRRFGRLVVLDRDPIKTRPGHNWACVCDCGQATTVHGNNLRRGYIKSCGCMRNELSGQRARDDLSKHNHARIGEVREEYAIWANMLYRCRTPTAPNFERYGGRGIRVCVGWLTYEQFYADMGKRPSREHSLDRNDNDGHYSCGHCEECVEKGFDQNVIWATKEEQANNRSTCVYIEHDGERKTIAEWSRQICVSRNTIARRLKCGLPPQEILAKPRRLA